MKARYKGRAQKKHSSARAWDNPSQWQRKYGKNTVSRDYGQDGQSLDEWVASVQALSTVTSAAEESFDQFFTPENAPADKDAAAVIFQMNKILGKSPSNGSAHDDFEEMDFHSSFHLGTDHVDANDEFSEFLRVASIGNDQCIGNSHEEFAGKSMALLFRRSHDETLLRKCFLHFSSHVKESKLLKGRVFSWWKRIAIGAKKSEDQWVRRTRRRHDTRRLRHVIQTWLRIIDDRSTRARRAAEMNDWRMQAKVMTSWHRILRREKVRRMELQERHERVQLAQRTNEADCLFRFKLKRVCVVRWRAATKKSKSEQTWAASLSKQKSLRSELIGRIDGAMIEDDSSASVAQNKTPTKTPEAKTICITPERETPGTVRTTIACLIGDKENQRPNQRDSMLSCPIKNRQSEHLSSPLTKKGKQQRNHREVPPREKPKALYQTSNKILRPLKHRGSTAPVRNSSTPKMILDMNQRKQEREKRREVLRRRHEQKAIERKELLEEKNRRKEEAVTKAQREFMQCKAAEERRKRMASARWKQARRLAALHYRISLQKRMLRGWRDIFQIVEFNERKAHIAWSDATSEKCWRRWKIFTEEAQGRRKERMLKSCWLADDFNKRRLFAKSFAALEEHREHTLLLIDAARRGAAAAWQASALTRWRRVTADAGRERRAREARAARKGERCLLRGAVRWWRSGALVCREEREMNLLVEAKWDQVHKWLEEKAERTNIV